MLLTRKSAIVLLLTAWLLPAAEPGLFREFQDPPKRYSPRPFWFWNGLLDEKEVDRQIREMVSQHVFGAYVHNRTGLQTPYLSEEYFRIVKSGFDSARKHGFMFGLVDEYEWPGGEARDPWSPGLGSRVIARNGEFRMRGLVPAAKDLAGPGEVDFSGLKDFQFATVARLEDDGRLDGKSMKLLEGAKGSVGAGRWRVTAFTLQPVVGRDGGLVDLMSHDAIATWLELVHERYYKLSPQDFGSTIDSFFTDHEGAYGARIAWTPLLFETFRKMKGYDLRPMLAALAFDAGPVTPKVRCDYLDVVSELYTQSYMKQVADWCARHKVAIFGHLWEETLMAEAFWDGDLQRAMRAWTWPGVDTLYDLGRWPRDFKVAGSVSHFRQTRFFVENQAEQGEDSYQDLEKLRYGTNMIAAWGPNLFVPCGFNYHARRIEYPHDLFFHQPYWKYFHHYADYTRRLAFMNDGGRHYADILLFQPTETAWAHADPNFSPAPDWKGNPLPRINMVYGDIMNRLAQELRDFDVADSHYLAEARIEGATLRIANEVYRAVVLPPTTTMRRATMRKLLEFQRNGGVVVAVDQLPTDSMDEGRNDAEIVAAAGQIAKVEGVEALFPVLDRKLARDVTVVKGERTHIGALHREKDGLEFYWLVNDTDQARELTLRLATKGVPEKWDAETGRREALESRPSGEGREVVLHFEPWDAFYVVFGNPEAKVKAKAVPFTPLRALELKDGWTMAPDRPTLSQPYALKFQATWDGLGETKGYAEKKLDTARWTPDWLSAERLTVREWELAGPYPNEDHAGCFGSLAPETKPETVAWKRYVSPTMAVDLYSALGLAIGSNGTAYARTWVYSPVAQKVEFRVAATNNAHLWVNGEKLLDWHIHPWYYEMREDFALARTATLQAGWNPVMVKVSRFGRGKFAFLVRAVAENLVFSTAKTIPPAGSTWQTVWYRVAVPVTAVSVKLPKFRNEAAVFYNGARVTPSAEGVVRFPAPAAGADNVLAVKLWSGDEWADMPVFTLGRAPGRLGSWLDEGLTYYSGGAAYETEFELPAAYAGRQLTLELGEVGVAAEVWLNGKALGSRVWRPFRFDVSGAVKPGRNRLRVLVTNTMENERAVENHAQELPRLRHSGLIGPVRLVDGGKAAYQR